MPNVKVTDKQMRIIVDALEFYVRMGMGQFGEIVPFVMWNHKTIKDAQSLLHKAVDILAFAAGNETHGIMSPDVKQQFRDGYVVMKVLQKYIAEKENLPSWNVWHNGLMGIEVKDKPPKVEDD